MRSRATPLLDRAEDTREVFGCSYAQLQEPLRRLRCAVTEVAAPASGPTCRKASCSVPPLAAAPGGAGGGSRPGRTRPAGAGTLGHSGPHQRPESLTGCVAVLHQIDQRHTGILGFQNSATGLDLGLYAARSYSLIRPPRTTAVDSLLGEVGVRVAGAGRAGGCDGVVARCREPRTRPGPAAGAAGRRSASGR
jgi:hypothetical protein